MVPYQLSILKIPVRNKFPIILKNKDLSLLAHNWQGFFESV